MRGALRFLMGFLAGILISLGITSLLNIYPPFQEIPKKVLKIPDLSKPLTLDPIKFGVPNPNIDPDSITSLTLLSLGSLIVGSILLLFTLLIFKESSKNQNPTISGIALNVNWHEENFPFPIQLPFLSHQLLSLNLQQVNNFGNISGYTAVELRLKQRRNVIFDGDEVEVIGNLDQNGILVARKIINRTKGVRIEGSREKGATKYLIALIPGFLGWSIFALEFSLGGGNGVIYMTLGIIWSISLILITAIFDTLL